jgi:hypothetical protein
MANEVALKRVQQPILITLLSWKIDGDNVYSLQCY